MTAQEIFDKAWQYFFVEKHPRSVERGKCFYRHPSGDGRRCAAGLFIKDEQYSEELETLSTRSPRVRRALNESGVPASPQVCDLLQELQWAHDVSMGEFVEEAKLRQCAELFGLAVPA